MTVKALGIHYFEEAGPPLSVCKVDRKASISHDFDLTEIEHFHDFTELVFILKGKGTQVIEEQEYPVSAGDVFVLQGNQKHYFKDASGIQIINVMFDMGAKSHLISNEVKKLEGYNALFILEPHYRAKHHFKNKLHLKRSEMAKLELMINAMIYEQGHKDEGYQLILTNRLQELLVLLSRHYSRLEATEAKSLVRIGKVIDYLEANYAKKIYLDHLAEMCFMSTRNFQRIFKKAVGSSPSSYLMDIRLQKARQLLRETDQSISSVALDTGFGDGNYFIKCFKKANGVTPVKYRMRFNAADK